MNENHTARGIGVARTVFGLEVGPEIRLLQHERGVERKGFENREFRLIFGL